MYVVSVINMKGGVGKTTLAVNIADCLSRRHGKKVLLIDIDPQFNATQCLFSPEEYVEYLKAKGDTIINVFDRQSRTYAATVDGIEIQQPKKLDEIRPVAIKENYYLLPGSLELYRIEMSPGEGRENRLKKYIQAVNEVENFDFVIIDTPPTPSIWMTSALIASNYYLIPVKPEPISFVGIDLLQSIINDKKENLDLTIECIGLILTIVEEQTKVYQQTVEKIKGSRWAEFKYNKFLPKRTVIAREQLSKSFILDIDDTVIKAAIAGIVDELLTRVCG